MEGRATSDTADAKLLVGAGGVRRFTELLRRPLDWRVHPSPISWRATQAGSRAPAAYGRNVVGDRRNCLLAERVVVQLDGSLDLESRRQEREEESALVESVTCAGSPDVSAGRRSGPPQLLAETEQQNNANMDCSE
ncbi:hypothetical protein NDU88_007334 [Pleurodeles waltl]|uniref:Uncharacterized protein n=1 Tax=Pleurodeles waltl TaxID=8319 RepID=A0AAV7NXN6_PLEWA|nr:hypothetical protein NDU88_007334 [Pleurodeles waltl]